MTSIVEFGRPSTIPASDRRLLLVFDGGNSPGYSSVAVSLTEEATPPDLARKRKAKAG